MQPFLLKCRSLTQAGNRLLICAPQSNPLVLTLTHAGAMMFDVFKTWRLDSGDYTKYAEMVVSAWEGRCKQVTEQGSGPKGIPQQRPALMHSNLKDVDHVKQVAK